MTKQEMILDFISKHPEPNQELTPIMVQHWKGRNKDGEWDKFWRSDTGKITETNPGFEKDNDLRENKRYNQYRCLRACSTYGYIFPYAEYCNDYDEEFIAISAIKLNGNRHKDGEIENWKFTIYNPYYWKSMDLHERVILFKNDRTIYNDSGNPIWQKYDGKYYNKEFIEYLHILNKLGYNYCAGEQFKQFVGDTQIQPSRYCSELNYPWAWGEWYKKSTPRTVSKKQEEINSILNVKLDDIKELERKYPIEMGRKIFTRYDGSQYTQDVFKKKDYFHFEVINEDYCVIRFLARKYHDIYIDGRYQSKLDKNFAEPIRIYIDKKGKPTVTEYSAMNKTYQITSTQLRSLIHYNSNTSFGNVEDISKWEHLKWIEEIIKATPDSQKVDAIIAILRHPILEKIYKSGYPKLAHYLLQDGQVTQQIMNIFGVKENPKGSLTKSLGVSKAILKTIEDSFEKSDYSYYNNHNIRYNANMNLGQLITSIKTIFNTNDISGWNQETIEMYFEPMKIVLRKGANWKYNMLPERNWYWRDQGGDPITEKELRIIQHFLRMGSKDITILNTYLDVVTTYHNLHQDNKPEIESVYSMNNVTDIMHYHDAIVALLNQQREEDRARWNKTEAERLEMDKKKFEKLQDERMEKYNYVNDEDDFLIRVPAVLSEITTEGQTLGHCVGGYVHNHAVGETNILFLRKKDTPNIPFFTIEVNRDRVIQIHGSHNRWLCSENTDAVPFVLKWLKKTGIQCDNSIILGKGTGYCPNGVVDGTPFGL